jgi:uncharacterized protein (TIGR03118 family)
MKVPRRFALLIACSFACVVAFIGASASATAHSQDQDTVANLLSSSYAVHNLVSDGGVPAAHTDPDLVNPWGLVFNPTAVAWVANNETGVSTLYNGEGVKQSLVVTVPTPPKGTPPSHPTGIVFSGGADFVVGVGTLTGASRFIFATEDGTISGWAPNVDPTHAILKVDNSAHEAIYKGLALAGNGTGHFLYATDFHHARVDVFDASFNPVTAPGGFRDPRIPSGYAPFGIQNILGDLYVTYAKQDKDKEDDVAGQGFGFVNVFDANGNLIRRLVTRGVLNAPWGLALAPADFGQFSNTLLVGNFGDGRISAFDLRSGEFKGQLRMANHRPIELDGLWALVFGNGVAGQPTNALFFTAGPDDEKHGLYGRIDAVGRGDDRDDDDRD